MQTYRLSCAYCKTVNVVCFWGPRPVAAWKRPVLLFCSALLAFGFGTLIWLLREHPNALFFSVLAVPLTLAGTLGLLISVHGCNACVARLFGEV